LVPGILNSINIHTQATGHIMNNTERKWQDIKYVLGYFSNGLSNARKEYVRFVEEGIEKGRRPELVGRRDDK
jgi:hypothetical protein